MTKATREHRRQRIAKRFRELRIARGLTLRELAVQLDISPSRLSEIERGAGSFSAEQLISILEIFNVPISDFTANSFDPAVQLQKALARLGATHLYESPRGVPSELLVEVNETVREALLDGAPRLVTALPSVLVQNIHSISLSRLQAELAELALQNRLGWLVDSALDAIDEVQNNGVRDPKLREARLRLGSLARRLEEALPSSIEDILDRSIRSERTLDLVRKNRSSIATKWNVITTLQPDDFRKALKVSLGSD